MSRTLQGFGEATEVLLKDKTSRWCPPYEGYISAGTEGPRFSRALDILSAPPVRAFGKRRDFNSQKYSRRDGCLHGIGCMLFWPNRLALAASFMIAKHA